MLPDVEVVVVVVVAAVVVAAGANVAAVVDDVVVAVVAVDMPQIDWSAVDERLLQLPQLTAGLTGVKLQPKIQYTTEDI